MTVLMIKELLTRYRQLEEEYNDAEAPEAVRLHDEFVALLDDIREGELTAETEDEAIESVADVPMKARSSLSAAFLDAALRFFESRARS